MEFLAELLSRLVLVKTQVGKRFVSFRVEEWYSLVLPQHGLFGILKSLRCCSAYHEKWGIMVNFCMIYLTVQPAGSFGRITQQ